MQIVSQQSNASGRGNHPPTVPISLLIQTVGVRRLTQTIVTVVLLPDSDSRDGYPILFQF
jgi:hypothetical protein